MPLWNISFPSKYRKGGSKTPPPSSYEIEKISKAIADSPGYIQLQALQTLASISKDPASKVYFLNGSSPTPLPLMHMGDLDGARLSTGSSSGGAVKSSADKVARTK